MSLQLQTIRAWTHSFYDFLEKPPRIFRLQTKKLNHVDFFVTKISVKITSNSDPFDWYVSCVYLTSPDSYETSSWSVISYQTGTITTCNSKQVSHSLCDAVVLKKAQARFEVDIHFVSTIDDFSFEKWDDQTKKEVKTATIQFENSSFNSSLFECDENRLKYIYDFTKQRRVSIREPDEQKFQNMQHCSK